MKAVYVLSTHAQEVIYTPKVRAQLEHLVEFIVEPQTAASIQKRPELLAEVQAIYGGWGSARLDEKLLSHAPELDIVFYGAGSVRGVVSDAFWERGLRITSAYAANAVPVVEYTLAQILFSLKLGWRHAREVRAAKGYRKHPVPGAFGTTVGLISLGMIGRMVAKHLKAFDVNVIAYDPFCDPTQARDELGLELVSLDELFQRAHVVSLHTPWLKETEGMITGRHFDSMRQDATFINTARGAIVCEQEMIEVLTRRPDLQAVLDVTYPEPPPPDSPLYVLPNVIVTPHIAGSMDAECGRMGQYMVEETRRYLAGEPLQWEINREAAARMA